MARLTVATLMVTAALSVPPPAHAQAPSPPGPEFFRKFLDMALDNLGKAQCGPGRPCTPATETERTSPPITEDQSRAVVHVAMVSTMAEHCKLDWQQRNFVPMMRHHRERLQMNERQMALVGLLHGITMGALGETLGATPCTPEIKQTIEQRMIVK